MAAAALADAGPLVAVPGHGATAADAAGPPLHPHPKHTSCLGPSCSAGPRESAFRVGDLVETDQTNKARYVNEGMVGLAMSRSAKSGTNSTPAPAALSDDETSKEDDNRNEFEITKSTYRRNLFGQHGTVQKPLTEDDLHNAADIPNEDNTQTDEVEDPLQPPKRLPEHGRTKQHAFADQP